MTTTFDLATVVKRLASACASPYQVARAAVDIAYLAEIDDPGVVSRAKDAAGYVGVLSALRSMMAFDRERHTWPGTVDRFSSLLWSSLGGRKVALASQEPADIALRGVGLAVACLAAIERAQLEAIRDEFLEMGDKLAAGDILVVPDPGMPARAAGSPLPNNPENDCNCYETRQLRRYRGDPDGIRVLWHKRYAHSLVTLLKSDPSTGPHPKLASGTPVDRTTPRQPPNEGFVPTKAPEVSQMVRRLFDAAAQEEVRVLVLPELSIADIAEVRMLLAAKPKWGALVVPGSMAAPVPQRSPQFWNQAPVWLNGRHVLDYNKIHPMYAAAQPKEDVEDPWAGRRPEYCTPGNTMSVLWSPEWSVTVVICSDLNSTDIQQALMQTKVNLVLAPILTPKLGNFPTTLAALAAQNQALIVTSNSVHPSPSSQEATSALYTPMTLRPTWQNDAAGELRVHSWLPSSGG